jgi:hypothetical protein
MLPLLLGLYLVPLRTLGLDFEYTPGDIGDPRFNAYVLEHGYRYLRGDDPNFWSPTVCYPHLNVIAMSDSHLGTLPIYAAFRAAGLDRETAFQAWFLSFFVLCYGASAWALRAFGFGAVGSAAGAYLFSFSLPVVAQMGHAQLMPRFLVPVAFVLAWRFLRTPTTRTLAGLAFCVVWQLYCAIYLGYFLLVVLGMFVVAYGYLARRDIDWQALRRPPGSVQLARFGVLAVAGLSLLPLAIPHWLAAQEIGVRTWFDMTKMMPQPRSFLLPAHHSYCWSWLDHLGKPFKFEHEHRLFIGAIPWLCVGPALLGLNRLAPEQKRVARAGALAVVGVTVLVMYAFDFSLYRLIASLPLANAVRAVTRIILVIAFPFAIALAGVCTQMELWAGSRFRWAWVAPALLLCALAVEQAVRPEGLEHFSNAESARRVRRLEESVRAAGPDVRMFILMTQRESHYWIPGWCSDQIDGLLASQDLGIPTLNAYSGNWPNGWEAQMRRWDHLELWLNTSRDNARKGWTQPADPDHLFDGLVVIGDPAGDRPAGLEWVRVVPLTRGD